MESWVHQNQSRPNYHFLPQGNPILNNVFYSKPPEIEKESSSSDSNSEDSPIGSKNLSKSKHAKLCIFLENINSKRKTISKGLQFAYKNINSAKDILFFISSSFLINKTNIPAQLCHLYLISDILFNSQNTNIKFSWVYKDIIHDSLPELFYNINEDMYSNDLMKGHICQLIKIWSQWKIFTDEYLIGLAFPIRNQIDERLVQTYHLKVKERLEKYEDSLLEIYSSNEGELKRIAMANGIFIGLPTEELISKLVSLKEYLIYKEYEIDSCEALNERLSNLKKALDIMKTSYNKLNPLDLDGIPINKIEYEYFDLPQSSTTVKSESKESSVPNTNEVIPQEEDIDGEPI